MPSTTGLRTALSLTEFQKRSSGSSDILWAFVTMTSTPDSKRRDARPHKRKRDPTDADRHIKARQKRMKNQKNETEGLLSSPKAGKVRNGEDSLPGTPAAQPGTLSQGLLHRPTTTSQLKAEDSHETGWTVSKPLGGRIEDIDPILTADERYGEER